MLDLRRLRDLDYFSAVAVTAAADATGRLHPVGDLLPKLLAVARDESLPRVRVVVVAAEQEKELEQFGLRRDPDDETLFSDPNDDFLVVIAHSRGDAGGPGTAGGRRGLPRPRPPLLQTARAGPRLHPAPPPGRGRPPVG